MVGLKRAGFSPEDISNLKTAYRILLRLGLTLDRALEEMGDIHSPAVDHMIEFVKKSERGFCRR
ncbi:MAG TPA: acyl-[acyl-carrier-protein]--UDP-N-acetylglucosamine O-acyltransferase, partial [Blastocatellia bacterium]|nr:acyl-[acyl-carrier-protein]--UDP-N-acetylglucosamine O-acyltransferase [Blastocatellia bacterium]